MWRFSFLGPFLWACVALATTYTPGVDNTCATDVTAGLNTFLAGVPDGTATAWNTIQLNGCYRIDGEPGWIFTNRNYISIQGPAELRNVTLHTLFVGSQLIGFDRGANLSVSGLTIRGTHTDPTGYDSQREHEYAITVVGSSNIRIERNTLRNVYGDGVQISPYNNTFSDQVLIQNNRIDSTGRHGVTVDAGTNISILRNSFDRNRYLGIDLEIEVAGGYIRNTRIENNVFGTSRIAMIGGTGPFDGFDGLVISHNRYQGVNETCFSAIGFTQSNSITNVVIDDNVIPSGSIAIAFVKASHVRITNNRSTGDGCGTPTNGSLVSFDNGDDIVIAHNFHMKGPRAWITDPNNPTHIPTNITSYDNTCIDYGGSLGPCLP